jgi:molybdopterin converting factor small subunit
MKVTVQFFSYFRDLTGCDHAEETLSEPARLGELIEKIHLRFPRLKEMERSTLVAVGVEYQPPTFPLTDGDEVSLFPPVQGG